MKMELCLPCAVKLKAQGQTVKQTGGRNEKVTCGECGRRRFGTTYEVGAKEGR